MRPIERFRQKPKSFWASVRSLSQHIGYSEKGAIIIPSLQQMVAAFNDLELNPAGLTENGHPTPLAVELLAYFEARAQLLMKQVEPNLMDAEAVKALFLEHYTRLNDRPADAGRFKAWG